MKFEDIIDNVRHTLKEDTVPPVAGAEQGAPVNPQAVGQPQTGQPDAQQQQPDAPV